MSGARRQKFTQEMRTVANGKYSFCGGSIHHVRIHAHDVQKGWLGEHCEIRGLRHGRAYSTFAGQADLK